MSKENSPLAKYYRQPQIYIKLPTGADYYPEEVVAKTTTGEHPVFPTTANDEILFKTPDALMNGQATVDVIESCIPSIKDAWQIVNYDLDTILIAIRIATYGEKMEVTTTVPVVNEKAMHELTLNHLLDGILQTKITDEVDMTNGLKITVHPLTYKQLVASQLKTFEQQRMYTQVAQSNLSEEEKTKRYTDSFKVLTELNSTLLLDNIKEIKLPDGNTVTDKAQISEFIKNADAKMVKDLEDKLAQLRNQGSVKPQTFKTDDELVKKGAPATYQVPITFDSANFFV